MEYSKFGLNCPPFEQAADTAFYHAFPSHQAALDTAMLGVENPPGVTLITAHRGIGKTLIAGCLLEQLHRDRRALCISAAVDRDEEITDRLARGFSLEAPSSNVTRRIGQIVQRINVQSRRGESFIAVIDDAQHLSDDQLGEIVELMRAATSDNAKLSVLLLATPDLTGRLTKPSTRFLESKNIHQCAIEPLQPVQVGEYIRHRLRIAGGGNLELFEPDAISAVAEASQGVPRRINALCDAALRQAIASKIEVVTAAHVSTAGRNPADASVNDDAVETRSESSRQSVVDELGRILSAAPRKMSQLQDAVERLEQRAELAVSRTGQRLAELKDESVRQVREMPVAGADVQRIAEATSEADRVYRRMTRFCDQFAKVSASCEQRLAMLVSSLDAAQTVHEKLESLSEGVGELIDDARGNAADECDRLQSMFDEVRARREELSILLESAGKTNAVQLAETSEKTRLELARINQSVESARGEWTRLKISIDAEVRESVALIEDINNQVRQRQQQLAEIKDIEQRCAKRAMETAKSAELLSDGLQRAAATTQQLEKLTLDIQNAQQAADQAAQTLRQILSETDETQARATQTAADARQAATTIDRANKQLGDNVTAAQRVADHLANFEESAAQRIDAMIAAAEQRIAQCVDQAVGRIEASAEKVDQARTDSNRIREAAIEKLDETARRIHTVKTEAIESLQPILSQAVELKESIDQARSAAVASVVRSQESATAAIKAVADEVARAQNESVQSTTRAIDRTSQRVEQQLRELSGASVQSVEEAKLLGVKAIQDRSATALDDARQALERDTIETLKRLSAAGRQQMALIGAGGDKTREDLAAMTQRMTGELSELITRAQAGAEVLAEQYESADKRRQQVAVAARELAENIEQSQKCRDVVERLMRDVLSMTSAVETRTGELNSLSEQALARKESLLDTIARAENPTALLSRTIEQANRTAQALCSQTQRTTKATVEFTRSIERAKQANGKMESLIETGASVRDELDERAPQLADAIQVAQQLVDAIGLEATTAQETSAKVAEMIDETAKVRARLVQVQQALAEPVGVIRDAKAQAEELHGICLSVKRVFGAVSRASLDANDRIKSLHALLAGSQQAQKMLEQWVTEANHAQKRLASTVQSAPSINQTHPTVVIPDAADQPLPEILKATTGDVTTRDTRSSRMISADGQPASSSLKTGRLSPEDVRSMIANARMKVRNKELSSIK